jgi:hypothetical protein
VGHLWRAQRTGDNLSDTQLLALEPHCNERQLQHLLHQLEDARIVARDEEADWRLARDLGELSLSELYCSGSFHLPLVSEEPVTIDSSWDQAFSVVLHEVQQHGLGHLDRPLRGMYLDTTTDEDTP